MVGVGRLDVYRATDTAHAEPMELRRGTPMVTAVTSIPMPVLLREAQVVFYDASAPLIIAPRVHNWEISILHPQKTGVVVGSVVNITYSSCQAPMPTRKEDILELASKE